MREPPRGSCEWRRRRSTGGCRVPAGATKKKPRRARLNSVTWAEFVEVAWPRSYRREHDVPLKELREFIPKPAPRGVPGAVPAGWPTRALMSARAGELQIDLQDRSHLDPEPSSCRDRERAHGGTAPGVASSSGWTGRATWYLLAGASIKDPASPIRINPLVRFPTPASAASPPRPSPVSLTAEPRWRRSPKTSGSSLGSPCGGHRAMSCRSTLPA